MVKDVSGYLLEHRVLGICVAGALVSIVMGLIMTFVGVVLRTAPCVLFLVSVLVFPVLLINRWIRERILLNPAVLRWLIVVAVAVIGVTLLYLLLKLTGMLPERNFAYRELAGRNIDISHIRPLRNSVELIWILSAIYMCVTVISLMMYGCGVAYRNWRGTGSAVGR